MVELGICDWHRHKSPFISRSYAELHGHTQSQARARARAQNTCQEILFCDLSVQDSSPCPADILFAQQMMHKEERERDYADILQRSNVTFLLILIMAMNASTIFFS